MAYVSFNRFIIENYAIKYFNETNLIDHFLIITSKKESIYFSSVLLRNSLKIALKIHFYTPFVNML